MDTMLMQATDGDSPVNMTYAGILGETIEVDGAALVYQDVFGQRSAGKWFKVDSTAVAPVRISPILGFLTERGDTDDVRDIIIAGKVPLAGMVPGQLVWAGIDGGVSQTAPIAPASGQIASRIVGVADEDGVWLHAGDTTFVKPRQAAPIGGMVTIEHWPDSGARERQCFAYLYSIASGGTNIVPQMSGASTPSICTISASTAYSGCDAWLAFNRGSSGVWAAALGSGQWLRVDMNSPAPSINAYSILTLTGSKPPKDFKFQGSNDGGGTWIDLDVQAGVTTGWTDGVKRLFSLSSTASYASYRMTITALNNASQNLSIAEVELLAAAYQYDSPVVIGNALIDAAAANVVAVRFDDGVGNGFDTKTTFVNRTNAVRDIACEVVL